MKAESSILTLRRVLPSDLPAIGEYRADFLEKGGSMDGCSNLRRYENMSDWFTHIQEAEHGETCAPGWVPDTQLVCVRNSDGLIVGLLDIRHVLNADCLNLYGNIGYSIRHSQRRKGYSTQMLALAKDICRSMGMEKILVCCYRDNPASAKTIQHNGGILENEVTDSRNGRTLQRYWITL